MDEITKTGMLSLAFGSALSYGLNAARPTGKLDPRRALELAILSRILEKRLREMRLALPEHTEQPVEVRVSALSHHPAL